MANTLKLFGNGALGFIDWLGLVLDGDVTGILSKASSVPLTKRKSFHSLSLGELHLIDVFDNRKTHRPRARGSVNIRCEVHYT